MTKKKNKDFSSFRDPAGYIYYENNLVYRYINSCYFKQYDSLNKTGLFQELIEKGYLISHKEIIRDEEKIVLEVEKVPFISYPYEWGFEELKDAALLTLNIFRISLNYDMILKDASVYNIQFCNGKPIFIDTLSFDFYEEGTPWGAYGQFCRHFIAPLLLMSYVDERMNSLLKNYIDGIPLDLANVILKGRGKFTAKQHIVWHSNSISKHADSNKEVKMVKMSKVNLIQMIEMMIRQIEKLKRRNTITEWDDYYQHTNYDAGADKDKIRLVEKYLDKLELNNKDVLFDLGANDGKYSRLGAKKDANVVSYDIDLNCVNRNYNWIKEKQETGILPLFLDCTNPTPSIGFGCEERKNLQERGPVKGVMALALIHHIAISNNVPFDSISKWFSNLGEYLIIEFVPKEDSMVQKLLKTRKDIFNWYKEDIFEESFSKHFTIIEKNKIKGSKRTLYLMRRSSCEE